MAVDTPSVSTDPRTALPKAADAKGDGGSVSPLAQPSPFGDALQLMLSLLMIAMLAQVDGGSAATDAGTARRIVSFDHEKRADGKTMSIPVWSDGTRGWPPDH